MATATLPIEITDKVLTDSSLTEPSVGEVAWTSGATFARGGRTIVGRPSATVTITLAAPGVVNWSAHGLPNGAPIILETTGALPTGLEAGEIYYVVNRASGDFQLSATPGGAPIATTGSQSGTHTARASIHRAYESLIDNNTNNPPAIDDGTKWLDLGPTNLWSMVDLYRPSVTWAPSPFTFTLEPGQRVTSLFLGNLDAETVQVVIKVDGVTKKTVTRDLWTRKTFNPTDFCFKAWSRRREVQVNDLPLYSRPEIEVTVTSSTGMVGVGEVVIGVPDYLGRLRWGAKARAKNFTVFSRNSDGSPIPPKRQRNVPLGDWTLLFDKERAPELMALRAKFNGRVVVLAGLSDDADPYYPATLFTGLITDFELDLTDDKVGVLTLSAEEN